MMKWRVEACRCRECTLVPGLWYTRGPELGQVSEWPSWDAAYRYAKTCADNHWRKVAAAEARMERAAYDAEERQAWMQAWDDVPARLRVGEYVIHSDGSASQVVDASRVCPNGHYDCDDDDEALPVDGAVWVGSREFQWPQVKRYGDA